MYAFMNLFRGAITAVFLLAVLWKRMNAQGAIVTLFFGLFAGALRIVLELFKNDLSGFAHWYATLNFSHFAIFSFVLCMIAALIGSLTTPKPSEAQIVGLTWSTLTPEQRKANRDSYTKSDILISILLLALVISVLVYFTG